MSADLKIIEEEPSNPIERFDRWRRRAAKLQADAVVKIMGDEHCRQTLYQVFAHTKYLADCCLNHPDAVVESLTGEPSKILSEVARDLRALDRATGPTNALTRAIRPLKERATVAIGLAEISGKWTHDEVGASLSDLAERTLDAAFGWLTRLAYRHGDITSDDEIAPVPIPGMFVLSGGEFAADEPAYFGPLEIAVVFDEEKMAAASVKGDERVYTRIATELDDALSIGGQEGPIFQLHIVSRDIGEAFKHKQMALQALSTNKISEGLDDANAVQDRGWFATARVVAGDRNAGGAFLEDLQDHLWAEGFTGDEIRTAVTGRENEQEAISSTRALDFDKDAHKRLADTCRLALGQSDERFRSGTARSIYMAAAEVGAMDKLTAERLASNNDFFAVSRNRLQLVSGQPLGAEVPKSLRLQHAALSSYSEPDLLRTVLEGSIAEAQQQWLNVISPQALGAFDILGTDSKSQETADDTATDIAKLEDIGFLDGRDVSTTIDHWVTGQYGDQEGDSKKRLSAIAPGLLTDIGRTQDPDAAIASLDRLVANMPDGVNPFELLRGEGAIREAVVDLLGNAPEFGRILVESRELISELFTGETEFPADAESWLAKYPAPRRHGTTEQILAAVSDWLWENRTRLAVATLSGSLDLPAVCTIHCRLAEVVVALAHQLAHDDLKVAEEEGGRGLVVLAMNDFGGGSLPISQPLDIVFLFDLDGSESKAANTGARYTTLASRIIQYLTEPRSVTGVGEYPLFEVDTRSRPGGTTGQFALRLGAYRNYYVSEASATEQLALARARVLNASEEFQARIEGVLADLMTRPRQGDWLLKSADQAREREARHDKANAVWDVLRIRGGHKDLDLVVQCLQLKHGSEHPYVLLPNIPEALAALRRTGCITHEACEDLAKSYTYWSQLRAVQGFTGGVNPAQERPRDRLADLLAKAGGVAEFTSVEPLIRGHADRIMSHYDEVILGKSPIADDVAVGE